MNRFNKFKVIFHMQEHVKVGLWLNNIVNLISDIGPEYLEIEMITNGDAVKALVRKTSQFGPMLQELAEKEVVFCACENSMRNFGIHKSDLLDFVNVDTSSGSNIVRKRAAGWTYICP